MMSTLTVKNLEKSKFLLICSAEFLASGIYRVKSDTGVALLCFHEKSLETVVHHKKREPEVLNGPGLISDPAGSTKPQDTADYP